MCNTYEAIANSANPLEALLLQILNRLLHNRIHGLISMRVVAISSLCQPLHNIKPRRGVQADGIAIEQVRHEGIVSIGSELISHQLAVLPDADYVWQVENRSILVHDLALGLCDVGFDAADFNRAAGELASVEEIVLKR
jgi:hypothetical protein